MANLSKRDAADVAMAALRGVASKINITSTWISRAATAGYGVSTDIPSSDPIATLASPVASGSQMISMLQQYATLCAKTIRIRFVRSGDSYTTYFYGYVPSFTPVAAQLTPSTAAGYGIFATTAVASRSAVLELCQNLNSKIQTHADNNQITISYCHSSCHSNSPPPAPIPPPSPPPVTPPPPPPPPPPPAPAPPPVYVPPPPVYVPPPPPPCHASRGRR